jgi:hypothetical protein
MSETRTQQGGHTVVVSTTERSIPGHELRTTSVDGRVVDMADHNIRTGDTHSYTSVNHGIFGATPSGTFKK